MENITHVTEVETGNQIPAYFLDWKKLRAENKGKYLEGVTMLNNKIKSLTEGLNDGDLYVVFVPTEFYHMNLAMYFRYLKDLKPVLKWEEPPLYENRKLLNALKTPFVMTYSKDHEGSERGFVDALLDKNTEMQKKYKISNSIDDAAEMYSLFHLKHKAEHSAPLDHQIMEFETETGEKVPGFRIKGSVEELLNVPLAHGLVETTLDKISEKISLHDGVRFEVIVEDPEGIFKDNPHVKDPRMPYVLEGYVAETKSPVFDFFYTLLSNFYADKQKLTIVKQETAETV